MPSGENNPEKWGPVELPVLWSRCKKSLSENDDEVPPRTTPKVGSCAFPLDPMPSEGTTCGRFLMVPPTRVGRHWEGPQRYRAWRQTYVRVRVIVFGLTPSCYYFFTGHTQAGNSWGGCSWSYLHLLSRGARSTHCDQEFRKRLALRYGVGVQKLWCSLKTSPA